MCSCTPLPPEGETEARERPRKPDTNRVPWRHSFARKYTMKFYWLTPFAYSFVNSDWLELVIHFHTNEHDGEQNAFTVRLSDNSDKFWDRDNSRRTEESHKYIFRR